MFEKHDESHAAIRGIVCERRLLPKLEGKIRKYNTTINGRESLWERFYFNVLLACICESAVGQHEFDAALLQRPKALINNVFEFNEFSDVYARVLRASSNSKKVIGQLVSATKSDYGFAPLAHEMSVAHNFFLSGLRVNFTDLGDENRFDFLLQSKEINIACDCKCILSDTGVPTTNVVLDNAHREMVRIIKDRKDIFHGKLLIFNILSRAESADIFIDLLSELASSNCSKPHYENESVSLEISHLPPEIFDGVLPARPDDVIKSYIRKARGLQMYTGFFPDWGGLLAGAPPGLFSSPGIRCALS